MSKQRHLKLVGSSDPDGKTWTLRVGFASADRAHVDQHFGSTAALLIYGVDPEQSQLLEVVQFDERNQDGNEQKLIARFDALEGCVAVYSQAVGASAVMQLKSRQVQPMKVPPGTPIADLIASLQRELKSGPSAWLAQALKKQLGVDPDRFDAMEEEGWCE